ncbi:MAG: sigma 54-interacting transcriptional regulator [Burkholderiales bacterium]
MQIQPAVKLIGQAPVFLDVLRQIAGIARIDAPVLIDGDTGTGKELVARAIHYSGPRSAMPFIPVNCGALPENLIENEFFGHARGAYTDAREPRPGLIAQAQGGTLFLDEVDALPLRGQVALLRFLQDLRYRPLGATRDELADVRVIAATNVNLDDLVAQRRFRPDLLYRLKIFSLTLPALCERPGDAELLARHFVRIYSKQYKSAEPLIAGADLAWIRSHSWPGNVRELENLVHRAVVLREGKSAVELGLVHAEAPRAHQPAPPTEAGLPPRELGFRRAKAATIRTFERCFIERALLESHGNVSAAARLSGQERRAFGKLMKKHGFTNRQFFA